MALINCPECQREISDKAAACPHCGMPLIENTTVVEPIPSQPKQQEKSATESFLEGFLGCFGIFMIGIIILIIGFSMKNHSNKTTKINTKPKDILLTAQIGFDDHGNVVVSNQDEFPWKNVVIKLNEEFLGTDDFRYNYKEIPVGKSLTIPPREFTKKDGARFNSRSTKIKTVSIHCDTPNGYGSQYGSNK